MDKLKRTLSFRKKKDRVPESSKPHQWQEDEQKVREGTCSFQVRYLGCIEVFESRGIQVCEEAVKALKAKNHRSVWSRMSLRKKKSKKSDKNQQAKGKYQRAILYVSGDALRVVDEISKGLIVDQTIEKVSFCAPDRNHEKGFSYICRDGTTRRWMCHGFLAVKESKRDWGERLSHAVGCAFAICLEKKQRREKETVTVTFNEKGTSFTRTGSFRHTTLTERLADPQSAIIAEPVPQKAMVNPYAVQRPHANDNMLERQGSFRGFSKLAETSPFKRQLSLRLNELPSTLDRQRQVLSQQGSITQSNGPGSGFSPIPEASPTKEEQDADSIAKMCQEVAQGLSALSGPEQQQHQQQLQAAAAAAAALGGPQGQTAAMVHQPQAAQQAPAMSQSSNIPQAQPIRQSNPWAPAGNVSDAEHWLASTATVVASTQQGPYSHMPNTPPVTTTAVMNGTVSVTQHHAAVSATGVAVDPFGAATQFSTPPHHQQQRAPHLGQLRSHSVDTAQLQSAQSRAPTLGQISHQRGVVVPQFQSQQQNGTTAPSPASSASSPYWGNMNNTSGTVAAAPPPVVRQQGVDPFDAAWVAKGRQQSTNPFQTNATATDTVTKAFEVNL